MPKRDDHGIHEKNSGHYPFKPLREEGLRDYLGAKCTH